MNAREDLYPFRAPNAVFVMGPTASGKSDFAFALALELGGTVISADSMQIYRGLDIGTAKETPERRAAVRHEMIDVADLNEEYSVARYREESTRAALDAIKRGSLPIFAGGTGLYFESLFYPLSFADTPKDEELRARLNEELETYGAEHMLEKLRALDPAAAERLHPNNTRRVIRAIEIALSGEKNMTGSADEKPVPDVIAVKFEPAHGQNDGRRSRGRDSFARPRFHRTEYAGDRIQGICALSRPHQQREIPTHAGGNGVHTSADKTTYSQLRKTPAHLVPPLLIRKKFQHRRL